jgi:N-carbamoylputrescine amidase
MGRKLKVAVVQMDAVPVSVSKRLSRATNLITEAVNGGAQLVVLPEMFNTGYEFHERNYTLAEPMDGETVTWMKSQATQHNIHLAGTLLLLDKTDIYNAGLLVAPDGRTWRHDKINITLWERAYFREGGHITIADTDLGKLGLMICSDVLCPDLWVQYAGKGIPRK